VREQERLIKAALSEPFDVERYGHDHIDGREKTDPRYHPFAERFAEGSARPVFELMDGFTKRPLKLSD
jgi:hypothetical protein